MTRILSAAAVTMVIGMAAAAPAPAATLIVQSGWSSTGLGQVSRFDTALGRLDRVTVEMSASVGAQWRQVSFGDPFVTDARLSGLLATNIGSAAYSGTTRASSATGGAQSVTATGASSTVFTGDQLAMFQGTDPLLVTAMGGTAPTLAIANISGFGQIADRQIDRSIQAQFRVIYDYTLANIQAVPEPATWTMMIGGFGLVGAMMRRRGGRTAHVTA